MKLNCRPGDLAVIVRGRNVGVLVEVLEKSVMFEPNFWLVAVLGKPIQGSLLGEAMPLAEGNISDARLRPIRDQPGGDESLTWAALPQGAEVPQ